MLYELFQSQIYRLNAREPRPVIDLCYIITNVTASFRPTHLILCSCLVNQRKQHHLTNRTHNINSCRYLHTLITWRCVK
jgi:hypothetical protein